MISRILQFVRFSHTIFALPFALGAMLVAAHGLPGPRLIGLILLCMVFARTAAMVFNRLADWEIDKRNPRTEGRHRLVSRQIAIVLLLACSAAFITTTSFINSLCFWLSPVALVLIFFYSLTKRFTSFSHLFLGLALSAAPVGAWFAVRGAALVAEPSLLLTRFDLSPFVLALAVLLWVAGFDIIYATQDYEFDKGAGLNSLVVRFGVPRSLQIAQALHWLMLLVMIGLGFFAGLGIWFFGSLALILVALVFEHRIAAKLDLNAINHAFFTSNAAVGLIFVLAVVLDIYL